MIMFLIGYLSFGGAERQLVELAKRLHKKGYAVVVAVLHRDGPLEKDLVAEGVRIVYVDRGNKWNIPGLLARLRKRVREEQPEIIYSYLEFPNLLSILLKGFFPAIKTVWGIRSSNMDLTRYDEFWLANLTFKISRVLSRHVTLIIANSKAGRDYYISKGYPESKMMVIPNGIDTDRFCPDHDARCRTRARWQINDEEILIGLVARFDPMKDHDTFLKAGARLSRLYSHIRFVLVGGGEEACRERLQALASGLGIAGRIIWTGFQYDMPPIYNAMDILVSTSAFGEGFSNVIGEAMACGVPCVVTDVGDSAWIVGDTGRVVAPGDVEQLTDALGELSRMAVEDRLASGRAARRRIEQHFNVDKLVSSTEKALQISHLEICNG